MGKIWNDPKTPSQLRKALYDAQANTDGVTTTIDALAAVAVTADSPFGVTSQILVSDGTARKAITSGKTFDIDGTLAANSDAHIATQKAVKTYVDAAVLVATVHDADYGDIVVTGSGSIWTFDAGVVTTFARTFLDDANAAAVRTTLGLVIGTNVQAWDADLDALAGLTSAADKLPYFTGSHTASVADFTSFARSLVDDASASAARTTLGLGTISTQDASNVTITGGSITGITDLAVADGGTGASTASGARTNLSLVPGTDVEAWDADLDALAGVSYSADTIPYFTGTHTAAATTLTSFGRSLIDDTTAANARTTLGLGSVSTLDSDTDGSLSANSDSKIATQKAVKTYVDNAVTGLLDFKGATDCSGNPNYPAASKGDSYIVSVAGKIGGASGKSVDVGDAYFATADNAGGTDASVGSYWDILEHNLVGALLSANNLSDVASTSTARTNLGLAIGTDVQAHDTELDALASTTSAANKLPYFTGSGTATTTDFTAAGRALVDDADAAAQRTTLGVVIGTNVQAQDAELAAIAGLTSAADKLPYFTGSGTAALADLTTFGRSLIDDAASSNARTTLGLVIGTDVQAQDAELAAIAGLTSAANKIPRFTGSGTADLLSFSTDVTLAGNSDTTLSSQKAVKAYVDSKIISSPLTLYVATTGNDTTGDGSIGLPWLTVGKALTYLAGYHLAAAVTITLADGHYTALNEIGISHPQGFEISITGTNLQTTTLTSVQSSAGSSGARTYILNVGSVSNIIVDDYVMLRATTGGSNPMYLRGVWKVTNVDGVNTRITVASGHFGTTVSSGAVTDTIEILKSVLVFSSGQAGVSVAAGTSLGGLSKVAIVGGGALTQAGISVFFGNSAANCTSIGVYNWDFGVNAALGTISLTTSAVSQCGTYGMVAQSGGLAFANSGCAFSGCAFGYASIQNSTASANSTSSVANSTIGYYASSGGFVTANSSNAFGNATGGFYADTNSRISASSATSTGNGEGVGSHGVSYVNFAAGTSTGNTGNFSPAVNTLGNENSYIDT